jgi:hypothetical protein
VNQDQLFYDSENDALRSCIAAAGGTKFVAHALWPPMKIETAAARLNACLDSDKYEKLTFAEIIAIGRMGRDKHCHALMHYLGAELAYDVKPLSAKDELATALDRFEALAGEVVGAIQAVQRAKVRGGA